MRVEVLKLKSKQAKKETWKRRGGEDIAEESEQGKIIEITKAKKGS